MKVTESGFFVLYFPFKMLRTINKLLTCGNTLTAIFGSETNTFHFNYLHGSAMVSSITNNLGFGVSKYYEDSRNLITCVSNYFGEDCISAFIYDNDALGRRTERLDFDENLLVQTNSFRYNNYSEIAGANMNTNNYQFTYDDIGNRVYAEFPDHEADYGCNAQNAYTEISAYNPAFFHDQFTYDLDGNMLTNQIRYSSYVWYYTWNAENRMTSATNTADGTYVTYKYDYQGRMFEKITSHGGSETRRDFIWNNNNIIQELITNNSQLTTNIYTWANGETLTASLNGETVFYAHDANKNVTGLVDDSGTHLVHYDYSPFGVQSSTVYSSPFTVSLNPFRFSNEYFDETTGQVEFWRRKYFPQLGKFASRDPIGVQGGLNEYAICANDLINYWDEWGFSKSFYAGGEHSLMFRLAAEEQYVTKMFKTDEAALKASNQTEAWGSLHVGSIKNVEMFVGQRMIDAGSIVNESGKVYIYAHGLENGDIMLGGDILSPNDIEGAYMGGLNQSQLRGVWSISCWFGENGKGAQQWHEILGIPVIGHIGQGAVSINAYIKYVKPMEVSDSIRIRNEFTLLINEVLYERILYESFYKEWERLFNKWEDKGCIEKAYWHVYDQNKEYKRYPKRSK
jgi:RHS repeat-associated protein